MELANQFNNRPVAIRAAVTGRDLDRLGLDQYVCLEGGVSGASIVLAFRKFETQVMRTLSDVRNAVTAAKTTKLSLEERLTSSAPESRATSDKGMLASPPPPRFRF